MTGLVIVGFHSTGESVGALRWGIEECKRTGSRLTVVHASEVPIAVRNGPSAAIAHQLGNPTWASVYSIVSGLDAPAVTTTIVRSGEPVDVLASEAGHARLVVLGPRRRRLLRRFDTQRQLLELVDCPVIRIEDRDLVRGPIEVTARKPEQSTSQGDSLPVVTQ